MNNSPAVSIIVPVYKAERYLQKCVNSILAQTYTDFEVLLVDDGSPDMSGAICEKCAVGDNRIKVFHKENGGVSSARNYGLDNAVGDWICFVDSDDIIDDIFLENFHFLSSVDCDLFLQGYKVIEADIVKEVHEFSYDELKTSDVKKVYIDGENLNINNSPVSKLFKRDIIESNNIRFDASTSYGEDHLFVLTYLLYVKNISISNKSAYLYIHYFNNISLTKRTIPNNEFIYYVIKTEELQTNLNALFYNVFDNDLQSVKNQRTYSNIYRFISQNTINTDISSLHFLKNKLEVLFSNYIGLPNYHKLMIILYKNLPVSIFINLVKVLLWLKLRKKRF